MSKTRRRMLVPKPVIASSPGILTPPHGSRQSVASIIAYDAESLIQEEYSNTRRIEELRKTCDVVWVNVVGLGTIELLEELGQHFNLHRLALEDVLNVTQRPKVDDYVDNQFIVARMPLQGESLTTEQLSVFLGKGFVLTFQEQLGDCFDGIRKRLQSGRQRIRSGGSDYLAYSILDALVDSYFPLLERLGTSLEEIEEQITDNPQGQHVQDLHGMKRDLVTLRRYVWPLRELLASLLRQDSSFFSEKTRVYLRDCYDHSIQALDLVESYRDISSGLLDLYLSIISQRMNEVMKVLTIIATIFIPLSFVAGLYGMNFNPEISRWNMPELNWPWGYAYALGLMILCAGGMLLFFWRKGWFR